MKITLVTTTHDRPLCFSLLERWMSAQTIPWYQWLVVNDSSLPDDYTYTMGQEVIERDTSEDTFQSIRHNWLAAIPHIKGDVCFCVEDDDYLSPRYLEVMMAGLEEAELVGVAPDYYYLFPRKRWSCMRNRYHASLACTAFRSNVVPHVERICKVFNSVFIDMYLWAEWGSELFPGTTKIIHQPEQGGKMLHVGMKQMPGAAGLGMGHQMAGEHPDGNWAKLREWMGSDVMIYKRWWDEVCA